MARRSDQFSGSEESPPRVIRRRQRRGDDTPIKVTDDWPGMAPITDEEVRVIEAFFGDLLDELFGPIP
jgi:hypothetical protein